MVSLTDLVKGMIDLGSLSAHWRPQQHSSQSVQGMGTAKDYIPHESPMLDNRNNHLTIVLHDALIKEQILYQIQAGFLFAISNNYVMNHRY